MNGDIAINDINPKASVIMFPFNALHTPITNGSINVAVRGPQTLPPASKDAEVNIFGHVNISMNEAR